jgi:hypothetical protein
MVIGSNYNFTIKHSLRFVEYLGRYLIFCSAAGEYFVTKDGIFFSKCLSLEEVRLVDHNSLFRLLKVMKVLLID